MYVILLSCYGYNHANSCLDTRVAVGMGIPIWIPIPIRMGWEWEYDFSCGDPHMDLHMNIPIWISYGDPYGDIHMGIPTGENHIPILNTIPWVWGCQYKYPYGYPNMDPHTHGIVLRIGIWFSSVGIPIWIPIWISIWGDPYGDPHGYFHRIPVGMGWEWEWKFPSHGNPAGYTHY